MSTLKFAYLHKVDGDANNNKFYKMQENADGTFTVTYGREGAAKPATETYSMDRWNEKFKEKLGPRKGYTDITHLRALNEVKVDTKNSKGVSIISTDRHVDELIKALQGYANQVTQATYKVEAKAVTQIQIDTAQGHLDTLTHSFKNHYGTSGWNLNLFNAELTKLYIVIPRKMAKVADHLVTKDWTKGEIEKLIGDEQSNLDAMASQVTTNTASAAGDAVDAPSTTLLDQLGLEVSLVTDKKTLDMVKAKAQNHAHRVLRVFAVTNKATQKVYDAAFSKASDKKTDLLWHGSRSQNWFAILQMGLLIRPSNAVITGAMFGNFVYFAAESDKSMGYTDNGRWVNGRASGRVYMGLYDVHLGKQLIKNVHDSSCYNLHDTLPNSGCDSVWAKKGPSLYRDEFMVKPNQCTIKYLVEFSA